MHNEYKELHKKYGMMNPKNPPVLTFPPDRKTWEESGIGMMKSVMAMADNLKAAENVQQEVSRLTGELIGGAPGPRSATLDLIQLYVLSTRERVLRMDSEQGNNRPSESRKSDAWKSAMKGMHSILCHSEIQTN